MQAKSSRTIARLSGWVLGYDPGGNGKHGVAAVRVRGGQALHLRSTTRETVEDALTWLAQYPKPLGLGIDTLLAWSSGRNGDRPADCTLRDCYP
jgi:hypothetical protein